MEKDPFRSRLTGHQPVFKRRPLRGVKSDDYSKFAEVLASMDAAHIEYNE